LILSTTLLSDDFGFIELYIYNNLTVFLSVHVHVITSARCTVIGGYHIPQLAFAVYSRMRAPVDPLCIPILVRNST